MYVQCVFNMYLSSTHPSIVLSIHPSAHPSMHPSTYMRTHVQCNIYICTCACVSEYVHTLCANMRGYVYVCTCRYMCMCVCECVYICMFISLCTYDYIHIHTHISMCSILISGAELHECQLSVHSFSPSHFISYIFLYVHILLIEIQYTSCSKKQIIPTSHQPPNHLFSL